MAQFIALPLLQTLCAAPTPDDLVPYKTPGLPCPKGPRTRVPRLDAERRIAFAFEIGDPPRFNEVIFLTQDVLSYSHFLVPLSIEKAAEDKVALSYLYRVVEQRILEAQSAGAFENLPGAGKPLELENLSWVLEEFRTAYILLKNANVLPPEAELLKEIHNLEDLLQYVYDEEDRQVVLEKLDSKRIHLDILKRRSFNLQTVSYYENKLRRKLFRR